MMTQPIPARPSPHLTLRVLLSSAFVWVRSFPASPSGYRLSALDEARWTPDGIPHACGYMVVVGVLGVLGCWGVGGVGVLGVLGWPNHAWRRGSVDVGVSSIPALCGGRCLNQTFKL